MNRIEHQQGLTLVELMVTIAISGVIMAGVVNLYTNSIVQSKQTSDLVAIQESGRFALELLARDIRMAGYTGCESYDALNGDEDYWGLYSRGGAEFAQQAMRGIQGWEADATAPGDTIAVTDASRVGSNGSGWIEDEGNDLTEDYEEAMDHSDILRVWTAGDVAVDVSELAYSGSDITMTAPADHGFSDGDLVMISTCGLRVLGQVCDAGATSLTLSEGSSGSCNNNFDEYASRALDYSTAEVFSYRDVTYFVGKRDDDENTPPSLYRAVGTVAKEMVEGVENMQIVYGVDLDHTQGQLRNADIYVPAESVGTRWSDVVSVRISLLMRSPQKVLGDGSYTLAFNGASAQTFDDGYIRQVYSTTISLRNRNIGEISGLIQ